MNHPRQIDESLNDLRTEIEALDIHDADARERLVHLIGDIEHAVGNPRSADASIGERLRASILNFEVSHPRVSTLMNDVMEKLGNIGI
ncbi:MAG: DUF4404 family protein [Caldimonas sp.]